MTIVVIEHDSHALRQNPLGDPHLRKLYCVVPDDLNPSTSVPAVWWLAGYGGVGQAMLSHDPWQEGLEERLVRLRRDGRIGPMIVLLPDCFTKYGGSQYLSSTAHGDYEAYLLEELRGVVEARFCVSSHAIAGKSSGGFGALVHAMRHPELFSAVACHSGDMGFRLSQWAELPSLMNALREHGSLEAFVEAFDRQAQKKSGRWMGPMSMLACAAAYSPDSTKPLGVALPFDLQTGQIDDTVFARWMDWDPVSLIERSECQAALRSLKLVFIDCGSWDEYHLQWGARALVNKLVAYGVPHEHEEFPDGHRSTGYRLDVSLPRLYAALTG